MRAVLLFSSLLFALPLLSTFHLSWLITVLVLVVLVVSARRPENGLLVVAGLLPLATPIGLLMTPVMSGTQAGELLLLPLLTAATLRYGMRGSTPTWFGLAVTAGVTVIGAATITGLARYYNWTPILDRRHWLHFLNHVTRGYLIEAAEYPALHEGMLWLEGLVLAHITYLTLQQAHDARERVCRMMLVGVAAAALFTANRLAEVFLRNQQSLRATADVLAGVRIGIHAADLNAIGSLYALFVVPALWLAVTGRRVWQWAAFGSIALALWWSGSRTAVAAGCCGVVMVLIYVRSIGWRTIILALSLAAIVIALYARSSVRPLSSMDALRIRIEMGSVGLRLLEAHPGFGVGLGRFRRASRPLLSDEMVSSVYRHSGENAHNNFVQILAELGLVGACGILAVIGAPLLMSWKARGHPGSPPELAGLTGGVVAFLLTCLLGHPLLTPQCLWLFFLVLGAVAGLSWHAGNQAGGPLVRGTWLFVLSIALSIPWRLG